MITFSQPVVESSETMRIIRGCDHVLVTGNHFPFASDEFPDLTDGEVELRIGGMKIAGVITDSKACYFEITRLQTGSILQLCVPYSVWATTAGGYIIPLVEGKAYVSA